MKRRRFIAGLAGTVAFSSPGSAQTTARRYQIGMLDTISRRLNPNFGALQQALLERGYVEGRNLTFEYRSAAGGNENFATLAGELVRLDVDVIATRGTPAALAAKAASATIPVVMAAAGDPVAIARNPAAPAMNMTGFGASVSGAEGKRIAILEQMLSKLDRLAALSNLSNPSRRAEWNEIEASARSMGITAEVFDIRNVAEIEPAFAAAARLRADALVVGSDTVIQANQSLIVKLAAERRMPAIYTFRDFVDAGGLVSYGVSLPDLYRRAAGYIDRIFKGARPDQLPIEQPRRMELVMNLKAAKALGLTLPAGLLAIVDEIIE
jgi:putative ABC transport system substrate-binding protein